MAKKTQKYMINGNGNRVPIEAIGKYDRKKEVIVQRFVRRREKARVDLLNLTAAEVDDLQALVKLRAEEAGVELALRGNMQISSYDCDTKVALKTTYNIKLDDTAKEACRMMREHLIADISKSTDMEDESTRAILHMLDKAFTPNRSGTLSYAKVNEILELQISAPAWIKAKNMLINSIESHRGRSYVEVAQRKSRQHKFHAIIIDLADCWPDGVVVE